MLNLEYVFSFDNFPEMAGLYLNLKIKSKAACVAQADRTLSDWLSQRNKILKLRSWNSKPNASFSPTVRKKNFFA